MKTIKINYIHYKYFNGFTDYKLELIGQNAIINGRNDDGKTSIADGFLWLLFGKAQDGTKLNPKPVDENNAERSGLEPEVEAELNIDGKTVVLKRQQKENWTTKRGELEKTRSSDTTKYFIDTVPQKEKEWKEYINSIIDESQLELVVNPKAFMMLHWKERREILVELTGLTDEEIMQQDPKLQELVKILDGKSVDDMKKILSGQKKEVAQSIKDIPGRIQENTDAIERLSLGQMNKADVEKSIVTYQEQVADLENKLMISKNGNTSMQYQEELSKLNVKLAEANTEFLSNDNLASSSLHEDVNKAQQRVNEIRNQANEKESAIYRTEQALKEKEETREKLLNEYRVLTATAKTKEAEIFDEHQKVCPTCNQELPANEIANLIEQFNVNKSNKLIELKEALAANKDTGINTKQDIESLSKRLSELNIELNNLKGQLKASSDQLDLINNELTFEKSKSGTFESTDEYKKINQEIATVQMKISNAVGDGAQEVRERQEALNEARNSLAALNAALQSFEVKDGFDKQIEKLKQQDKDFKEQNNEIERQLFLIDEFTRTKVKLLEDNINDRFEFIKFKLFETQKNGGLTEICEATKNGVAYSSGLNTSARVKADINIVNVLSKSFDISAPLFIDNAEGINMGQLPQTVGQCIELRVAEEPGLKVEVSK